MTLQALCNYTRVVQDNLLETRVGYACTSCSSHVPRLLVQKKDDINREEPTGVEKDALSCSYPGTRAAAYYIVTTNYCRQLGCGTETADVSCNPKGVPFCLTPRQN